MKTKKVGRHPKFTRAEKSLERKLIIQGIADGWNMLRIANSLGYKSKQAMLHHHPGVRYEALSKIRL